MSAGAKRSSGRSSEGGRSAEAVSRPGRRVELGRPRRSAAVETPARRTSTRISISRDAAATTSASAAPIRLESNATSTGLADAETAWRVDRQQAGEPGDGERSIYKASPPRDRTSPRAQSQKLAPSSSHTGR